MLGKWKVKSSIDEAFLEFKGFENYDLEEYGKEIKKKALSLKTFFQIYM